MVQCKSSPKEITICHLHIPHKAPPPPKKKNCISIVFNFFGTAVIPGEMKNKGYKNFGGAKKVHYGRCASGV